VRTELPTAADGCADQRAHCRIHAAILSHCRGGHSGRGQEHRTKAFFIQHGFSLSLCGDLNDLNDARHRSTIDLASNAATG
jgi:hypothetical protein